MTSNLLAFSRENPTSCHMASVQTWSSVQIPPRQNYQPQLKAAPLPVLKVAIAGGGPVGLSLALLLDQLMGKQVEIQVFDHRWRNQGDSVVWKTEAEGNMRRQQVVTIQSRQYSALGSEVQDAVFHPDWCTQMWPPGAECLPGKNPLNIPIARLEDKLLAIAASKRSIQLVAQRFHPAQLGLAETSPPHVLAICEGARSEMNGTMSHFKHKFGLPDKTMYSHKGRHFEDVVLGLRVKSELSDPAAVLLTVSQNRYLLNAVRGEGFLNMRLTEGEARSLRRVEAGTNIPASSIKPALWERIQEGLKLFEVKPENLSAIVMFRISMIQRPRFSAELVHNSAAGHGTFGFLLGDTANAIHFWPGRGLNSGLSSAISLAHCLKQHWQGRPLRDADFLRHEAVMSMLQYRHKTRAWRHMVTTNAQGEPLPINQKIHQALKIRSCGRNEKVDTLNEMMLRLCQVRHRLSKRIAGMPKDEFLRQHLSTLSLSTLRVMLHSGAWDTAQTGGEEVNASEFHGLYGWA